MSHRRTNTTSLYNEHRRAGRPVKKRIGEHFSYYESAYRRGEDPYRTELRRHDQASMNRRFYGYLDGVRDPDVTPAWVETIPGTAGAPSALRCPARAV